MLKGKLDRKLFNTSHSSIHACQDTPFSRLYLLTALSACVQPCNEQVPAILPHLMLACATLCAWVCLLAFLRLRCKLHRSIQHLG